MTPKPPLKPAPELADPLAARHPRRMKHHYVPQFLLRRWTNAAGKLRVFAIKNGRVVSSERNPEYTGFENGLYTLIVSAVGFPDPDIIERKLFGPIDNDAANVLDKLERRAALSEEEHIAWTFFLSSLRIRQPETLEFLRTDGMKLIRQKLAQLNKTTLLPDSPSTEQWFRQNHPGAIEATSLTSWLPRMITHDGVLDAFGGLKWWCREFGTADPSLLLSDFPLHTENGLNDEGFFIQLPIAPNRIFFGTRSEQTEQFLSHTSAAELIARVNKTSLASASQRVWASTEADAKAFIEANRELIGKNVISFRSVAPWSVQSDPAGIVQQDD